MVEHVPSVGRRGSSSMKSPPEGPDHQGPATPVHDRLSPSTPTRANPRQFRPVLAPCEHDWVSPVITAIDNRSGTVPAAACASPWRRRGRLPPLDGLPPPLGSTEQGAITGHNSRSKGSMFARTAHSRGMWPEFANNGLTAQPPIQFDSRRLHHLFHILLVK